MAPAGPQGDVVLAVGEQDLVGEVGREPFPARVEVDHRRAEAGRFARHRLAEAPEGRPGERSGAFAFQHLGAAGDEPEALLGSRARIDRALHERERAGSRTAHVLRHLAGRRTRAMAVERGEMRDSPERQVPGQTGQQRLPRLTASRADEGRKDARTFRRPARGRRVLPGQEHRLVPGRERRRELRAGPALPVELDRQRVLRRQEPAAVALVAGDDAVAVVDQLGHDEGLDAAFGVAVARDLRVQIERA